MKQYLANLIQEDEFSAWLKWMKILIAGPTGLGKTFFVLNKFLEYCKQRGKKVLILCNRRMLKSQYEYDLAEIFEIYEELEDVVELRTYQELSEIMKKGGTLNDLVKDIDVVVMDEVHYFYSDADYNGYGTYVLLQKLVKITFFKTVVMLTATPDEVLPLIRKTYRQFKLKMETKNILHEWRNYCWDERIYNFMHLKDVSRFLGIYVPDLESLVQEIAYSEKKSIIFIDDRRMAKEFSEMLCKTKMIAEGEIMLLDSQVLDTSVEKADIRTITVGNKLPKKILITTSVLDNGVSIHDEELGNLVIATEDRVSFVQMLGRVRGEKISKCNVYIFPHKVGHYDRRAAQYENRMKIFNELEEMVNPKKFFSVLLEGWHNNEEDGRIFRNTVVPVSTHEDFFSEDFRPIKIVQEGYKFAINEFARAKVGNIYLVQKKFSKMAYTTPLEIAKEQFAWAGIEEFVIKNSTYLEQRKQQLKDKLLEVKNFNNEQLQLHKKKILEDFRKDLLSGDKYKNSSFSEDKLIELCATCDLSFRKAQAKDKKMRYNIDLI